MKEILSICFKKLPSLVCLVCVLSTCGTTSADWVMTPTANSAAGELFGDLVGGAAVLVFAPFALIGDAIEDAKEKREIERMRSANPLDSPVESRLTRRTSTANAEFAGGVPVDVSPYLLHNHSFAVTEKGIQRSVSVINSSHIYHYGYPVYEYDVVLTFKANKQIYKWDITVATAASSSYNLRNDDMKEYAAYRLGLVEPEKKTNNELEARRRTTELEKITGVEIRTLHAREGESKLNLSFNNVIQDSEPCYHQFDVEVEYQKTEVKKGKIQPEHFAVFNKVYRSDLMSTAGAVLEVQAAIWEDARRFSDLKDGTPLPVINIVRAVKVPKADAVQAWIERKDREKNEIVYKQFQKEYGKNDELPFANTAEERLVRRTSTANAALAEGIPVDISPYLLNENSFAVTEKGIQRSDSILRFACTASTSYGGSFEFYDDGILLEFDTAVSFEVNKQVHQMNATIVDCDEKVSDAKKFVKGYMQKKAAEQFGVDQKNMKKYNVKFLKTRKGKSELKFIFTNNFIQDIEPCYYQFDVEVEYQKKYVRNEKKPEHFAIINKVYRSNFTILEAAAIDVQNEIWRDLRKETEYWGMPLPVFNFVNAVKVKQ
jgi:hypothetical protein